MSSADRLPAAAPITGETDIRQANCNGLRILMAPPRIMSPSLDAYSRLRHCYLGRQTKVAFCPRVTLRVTAGYLLTASCVQIQQQPRLRCLMKNYKWLLLLPLACVPFQTTRSQVHSELAMPPNGNNERAEVSQWIGLVKISIDYHAPNVHGGGGADRTGHIWGELVSYGFPDPGFGPSRAAPWRVGANETTTITLSHDVKVDGKDLKAGIYGLFLDVEKSGPWTWIFSKAAKGWGSFQYDPKDDVLHVPVDPVDAPYTEFMTIGFDERRPASTVAYLQWEKKRISFKIEVPNINQLYVDKMREDLLSWPGFNYQNWQNAAQFCADNKINLEEALVWAEKAIHEPFRGATFGVEDFSTMSSKAAVLDAMGRASDADAVIG